MDENLDKKFRSTLNLPYKLKKKRLFTLLAIHKYKFRATLNRAPTVREHYLECPMWVYTGRWGIEISE